MQNGDEILVVFSGGDRRVLVDEIMVEALNIKTATFWHCPRVGNRRRDNVTGSNGQRRSFQTNTRTRTRPKHGRSRKNSVADKTAGRTTRKLLKPWHRLTCTHHCEPAPSQWTAMRRLSIIHPD